MLVFHQTGRAAARWRSSSRRGSPSASLDVTTTEFCDQVAGGVLAAVPERLESAGKAGIPQVVSLGALDMVNFGPMESVPERYRGRNLYVHNPTITLMRTTPDECREIARIVAAQAQRRRRADRALRPAARRLGDRDRGPGRSTTRRPTRRSSRRCASSSTRPRWRCTSSTSTSTTPEFALAMANRLHELIEERAMTRSEALARLRAQIDAGTADHRRRRRDRPLGQVRRGRRHRPDHHLQLGPLPDGRPRLALGAAARTATRTRSSSRWRARCSRSSRRRRCSPGVCGTDPFRLMDVFLDEVTPHRLQRRAELPHRRPVRRHVPAEPRGDRHGLRARGRHDPARAREGHADRAVRVRRSTRRPRWPRPARTCSCRTWA